MAAAKAAKLPRMALTGPFIKGGILMQKLFYSRSVSSGSPTQKIPLRHWNESASEEAPARREEYEALLWDLETEIMHSLDEREAGCP